MFDYPFTFRNACWNTFIAQWNQRQVHAVGLKDQEIDINLVHESGWKHVVHGDVDRVHPGMGLGIEGDGCQKLVENDDVQQTEWAKLRSDSL